MRSAHMTRLFGFLLIVVLVGPAAGVAEAQSAAPAPYVKVFVDGQPVASDVPPVIAAGRVLVPLRGVFYRLGAVVTWDPATQTVLAARGDTSITLRIGDPEARINGQPTLMDVPALLVDGRTMVPLRFISQALGSQVSWDAASTTVQIADRPAVGVPPSQAYPPNPQPPAPPPAVTGTVVGVRANTAPGQVQILVDKTVQTFKVDSTTAVSRINVGNNTGGSVALDALRPGDQVKVTVDQSGTAQSIQAAFKEVSGRIIAVTEAGVVVLENGDTFRLNRSVQVMRGDAPADASALRPGAVVGLRLNPQTNEIWGATIRQEGTGRSAGLASVTASPSGRELRAGDAVEVVATGAPGGRATFAIAGLRTGITMVESTSERGAYYGSYTVQPGDVVRAGEVTVRLVVPGGEVFTATASTRIQISAGAPIPPAATVPMITSPAEGATINSPFTVAGRARPGSRVKVAADYDGAILTFKLNGSLGTHVVTADQGGNWSVRFSDEPPVFDVRVTITAVEVDGEGRAISSATTVTATLK